MNPGRTLYAAYALPVHMHRRVDYGTSNRYLERCPRREVYSFFAIR